LLKGDAAAADDDKVNELTNTQLLDVVSDAVEKMFDSRAQIAMKEFGKNLAEVNERIEKVQGTVMQQLAIQGIEAARREFSDFDKFGPEIQKVVQDYPMLGINDAYFLAKSRKAKDMPSREQLDSERPDSTATRPHTGVDEAKRRVDERRESKQEDKKRHLGRRGFREILSDGIDKAIAGRKD
jgi:hypothetical protein